MGTTPLTDEQKKNRNYMIVGSFAAGAVLAFLITSLVLNKKYAKLEAQYWGM